VWRDGGAARKGDGCGGGGGGRDDDSGGGDDGGGDDSGGDGGGGDDDNETTSARRRTLRATSHVPNVSPLMRSGVSSPPMYLTGKLGSTLSLGGGGTRR